MGTQVWVDTVVAGKLTNRHEFGPELVGNRKQSTVG